MSSTLSQAFLKELELEYPATKKCLERIDPSTFNYQPHEKSMKMGYLALLVAEIPLWIARMITDGEIDLARFSHAEVSTNEALTKLFEVNMEAARNALAVISDQDLDREFLLKSNGHVLYSSPKRIDIGVTLNHWVHHRGQLTVYMRMNNIEVPSLYGPSADDKTFAAPK